MMSPKTKGLAHVVVGHDYGSGKRKERKALRTEEATGKAAKRAADKVQEAYLVDTMYVYLWDTYDPKTNSVMQYKFTYPDAIHAGEGYVFFFCGVTRYSSKVYRKGFWKLRKRLRECASLVQPFAYSVYSREFLSALREVADFIW